MYHSILTGFAQSNIRPKGYDATPRHWIDFPTDEEIERLEEEKQSEIEAYREARAIRQRARAM